MRKYKGSGSADYIIPTAIVGVVVGLGLFQLYSSGLLTKFFTASQNIELDSGTGEAMMGLSTDTPAGSLGGTPEEPVMKCSFGKCNIDYGDYILKGIPSNYKEFVQSSGRSGGTDELLAILEQLIQIAEEMDPPVDTNLLKILANKGHTIADFERNVENSVSSLENAMNTLADDPEISQKLVPYLSEFNTKTNDFQNSNSISDFQSVLDQVNDNFANPANDNEQTIIELVNLVSGEVVNLGTSMDGELGTYFNNFEDVVIGHDFSNVTEEGSGSIFEKILNPQISNITDLDSAIICISGNNSDTDNNCQ